MEPTDDGYNSGTSSTWGLPNRFGAGAEVQDFSSLDDGSDPDCDGEWTLLDALLLARYNSGALQEGSCAAVAAAGFVNVLPGDLNADGAVDPVDIGVLLGCLAQHDGGPLPDCP